MTLATETSKLNNKKRFRVFSAEQIRAVLKAIYKDGVSVLSVSELLLCEYDDIMNVLAEESMGQAVAKGLCEKPAEKWITKRPPSNSFWGLLAMSRGQVKEIQAIDMEDLKKMKPRSAERIRRARRYGMDFTRKISGKTIIIERIK